MAEWIDVKNEEAGIKQDKSVITTRGGANEQMGGCSALPCVLEIKSTAAYSEIMELLDGEPGALRSFCTAKISRMRQQLSSTQANGGESRKLQPGVTAKGPEPSDLNCRVPARLMNRIRLENTREAVKQVAEAQIHKTSACPDCQKKEAELAEITFLRRKKISLESALIQEKLEEQMYSRDVLTRIGEALGSLPKPSEDPRDLWQRLKGQKL